MSSAVAGLLLALALLGGVQPVAGQNDLAAEIASLKGLKSFAVVVTGLKGEGDNAEELRPYLTEDRVRTVVELELRRNGVEVSPSEDADAQLMIESMALKVTANGGFAVVLRPRVNQWVAVLPRRPLPERGKPIFAPTWQTTNLVSGPSAGIAEHVVAILRSQVDSFLNDYFKANPR